MGNKLYLWHLVNIICTESLEFPEKKKVFSKAVNYLKNMQREDGGWGEDGKSYYEGYESISKKSTRLKQLGLLWH